MIKLDGGQPLREALAESKLSIAELAQRTRELDPEHRGVTKSTIGHLVSTGTSERPGCRRRAAGLIAAAVDRPVDALFR
ncbi:hypothetical protein [Phaeacidiphilus oryzae]|uniref:hypothetical protein n=1 Tax=Phaeacidiphilus oryzae TaxID=348818 RepID=UPI00055FBC00|nr:hypothetical protein [Phaeacidiphilus oryzae]